MPTNVPTERPVAVFLFAHQDDECGVYEQIHLALQTGQRVVCAYLTTGAPMGGDASHRDSESLQVLMRLGVPEEDVIFAGKQLSIADGDLINRLSDASCWVAEWFKEHRSVAGVYVPAWEGGHPDHDALHAITVRLCSDAGSAPMVYQYPLYNGLHCVKPFFRVFLPLAKNGPVQCRVIPWRRRVKFLQYALSYPSQWRTWMGLFPFFLFYYIFRGAQLVQPVNAVRLQERPHEGALYYEMRQFSSWDIVASSLRKWTTTMPTMRKNE
jgi:LmbE family N-acetylglucosaminyl deacetylase